MQRYLCCLLDRDGSPVLDYLQETTADNRNRAAVAYVHRLFSLGHWQALWNAQAFPCRVRVECPKRRTVYPASIILVGLEGGKRHDFQKTILPDKAPNTPQPDEEPRT